MKLRRILQVVGGVASLLCAVYLYLIGAFLIGDLVHYWKITSRFGLEPQLSHYGWPFWGVVASAFAIGSVLVLVGVRLLRGRRLQSSNHPMERTAGSLGS
jgi:membrane protein implicated in regulation of membrane protease activity